MLILTIILGLVGVRLTRDQSDIVRDEARRLTLVLQNAQQQAILEGRPYAFALTDEGYRFLQLDSEGRLVPIKVDELLAPRRLPPAITLEALRPEEKEVETERRNDLILFDPSGEFPAFTMVFAVDNIDDLVWYVRGQNDGRIFSTPTLEPATT